MKAFLLSLFCLVALAATSPLTKRKTKVELAFEKYHLTPEIFKVAPKLYLEAQYTTGAKVDLGNEISSSLVKKAPLKTFPADPKSLYLVIFVDVDHSSDDSVTQYLHGMTVNIPGNQVLKGEIVSPYLWPNPPEGTGIHRYISIIYKQRESFDSEDFKGKYSYLLVRETFTVKEFTETFCLGDPVAGNFFTAQYRRLADAVLH